MNRVRFAPSPTGYLHVGNVRTALVNWLFVRKNGGEFILRIDDTDVERSRPEYEAAIREDMAWLGLNWDSTFNQSSRFARYDEAIEQLKKADRLYPCYETPEELEIQRKQLAARGLPPIYNRASQKVTDEQKTRKPHWRFQLNDGELLWHDLIRGETRFKATHMSDPVLIREDGVPLYTLASVVDDGDMNITHVIRGEDHVSNSAVQVQLYEALGFKVPQFAHMALLKTKDGELSKRLGGNDIRGMREAGIMPMAINSLLGRIGTSDSVEAFDDLSRLVESFDFKKFGRAPANYDVAELEKLNEKLLHNLPFSAVSAQLGFADEEFWNSIRANIKNISEAKEWWNIVHGEVGHGSWAMSHEEKDFLAIAAALLPPEPWDETTWDAWLAAIKPTTERKGKELFMPLRKALTGLEHGPELKKILPLIGEEKAKKRLA
ncbi:MAG: glutamate--tRNA ligase [Alphaproteobacteria bacterium]|nr:glutamate--tRNA ligase [Alphaproteobacteria bacterium]